jgi:small subunit ribosomal protein S8
MSMTSTDPIADMLTRVRNAILVRKHEVVMPHSKAKQAVAEILKSNGFLKDVSVTEASVGKTLKLVINDEHENAPITEIGRRFYVKAKDIPTVKRGRGIVVVSTPKGVMTGQDAKAQSVGGELICKVY